MHGHCAPLPPGRPVLRRRNLLSLARWWPTAAGPTGPFIRIYPETRPCALLVGCCLAHWGTWVWGGGKCCRGVAPPRPPGTPGRGEQGGAQPSGAVRASCQANGGPSSVENWAHRPGGDREPCPGGVWSLLSGQGGAIFFRESGAPARGEWGVLPRGCLESPARPRGGHLLQRTGRTCPGGTGSPAQGVFGVPCQAKGGPSSSENRAHRPGGDGESCPGGVRSLLPGQGGGISFREPGAPARGGRGVLPRGCSESPARPMGAMFLRGPGAPAQGGRGVLPRGRSESPARPKRRSHRLQRTGRTGPGRTRSPAQGVSGVSCQANGGPSSLENRAHRPGGDGESCPGGVRSLLPGQRGAIFF